MKINQLQTSSVLARRKNIRNIRIQGTQDLIWKLIMLTWLSLQCSAKCKHELDLPTCLANLSEKVILSSKHSWYFWKGLRFQGLRFPGYMFYYFGLNSCGEKRLSSELCCGSQGWMTKAIWLTYGLKHLFPRNSSFLYHYIF